MKLVSDRSGTIPVFWGLRPARFVVLCCTASFGVLTAQAFTSADADTLFEAHAKAFYQERDGRAWFQESTEGGKVSYWMRAGRGNIIIARETDGLPFPNPLQGIGCFDGPLVHFLAESNVVCMNHYHGISLYDAQNYTIQNNTCFSRWQDRAQPWIMLGQKKNQAGGNTVRNNLAHSYNFKADTQVKAEDNGEVTQGAFNQKLAALRTLIETQFGTVHPIAKRPRLEAHPSGAQ